MTPVSSSVEIAERIDSRSEPHLQRSPLKSVEQPTVIILSGLLGSGKTSTLQSIIERAQHSPSELGAIFNEKYVGLAQEDAARVRQIETRTLGGCACCLSNAEMRSTVQSFLDQGRKLIVVEQSGVTDGAQLRASLVSELGSRASVRLITLVDAEHLKAPPAVLNSSVIAADAVMLSHAEGDAGRIKRAESIIKELRGKNADHIQGMAGDLPAAVWEQLIAGSSASPRGSRSLSVVNPPPAPELAAQRRAMRDQLTATCLILSSSVSREALKAALAECPVIIDRAKGWIKENGLYVPVQYELKDENRAVISFGAPTMDAPALYEGRPHLFLISLTGTPPAEHFVKLGIPNFSASEVTYYSALYPSEAALDGVLSRGGEVPVRADGDPLALQAFRLAPYSKDFPVDAKLEFDKAFIPLLHRFVTWRLAVSQRLQTEPRARELARVDLSPNYGQRLSALGHSLSWLALRFGKILQQPNLNLLKPLIDLKPAQLLFQGLATTTSLEIDSRRSLTPELINDLATMALLGCKYHPELNWKELFDAALGNMTQIARRKGDAEWTASLPALQNSIVTKTGIKF